MAAQDRCGLGLLDNLVHHPAVGLRGGRVRRMAAHAAHRRPNYPPHIRADRTSGVAADHVAAAHSPRLHGVIDLPHCAVCIPRGGFPALLLFRSLIRRSTWVCAILIASR
jgi:hypothetical protein